MAGRSTDIRRSAFQARVDFWTSRTRLTPTRVRFRHMTRLWALCRGDNSLTFATALLDQPLPFQDLVIVHELVHLLIRDHSKYFWMTLELYQPDWRVVSRLAPESPAQHKQHYRVEDCPVRVSTRYLSGRITNTGLTSGLPTSYRSRYGNTDSYRMD